MSITKKADPKPTVVHSTITVKMSVPSPMGGIPMSQSIVTTDPMTGLVISIERYPVRGAK